MIIDGTSATPSPTDTSVGLGLGALGGTRAISLSIDSVRVIGNPNSPNTGTTERAAANRTPGVLTLESGAHADTLAEVRYDDGGLGLGLDLSSCTAIMFLDAANDQDTIWSLTLDDGVDSWTETALQAGNFAGDLSFSLAPFVANGVDLTSIESVALGIDPQNFGGDAILGGIAAIPEPSATVALLLGTGIMLSIRRRRTGPCSELHG